MIFLLKTRITDLLTSSYPESKIRFIKTDFSLPCNIIAANLLLLFLKI
jgi:hypothetical protein